MTRLAALALCATTLVPRAQALDLVCNSPRPKLCEYCAQRLAEVESRCNQSCGPTETAAEAYDRCIDDHG